MRHARSHNLFLHSRTAASHGLEVLEARRVLDGAGGLPACDELIEVTRLDGAESFWVRADDPEYGVVDCDCADEPGGDSDLYNFTQALPPAQEALDQLESGDEPGDDHDLYDFGQDRGPEIDDDAEYEAEPALPEPAPITDLSGVPTEAPAEQMEEPAPEPAVEEPASLAKPLALQPATSGIAWLSAAPALAIAAKPAKLIPATWTDLAALPEPTIVSQI